MIKHKKLRKLKTPDKKLKLLLSHQVCKKIKMLTSLISLRSLLVVLKSILLMAQRQAMAFSIPHVVTILT